MQRDLHPLDAQSEFPLNLEIRHADDGPAGGTEFAIDTRVAGAVACDFLIPELAGLSPIEVGMAVRMRRPRTRRRGGSSTRSPGDQNIPGWLRQPRTPAAQSARRSATSGAVSFVRTRAMSALRRSVDSPSVIVARASTYHSAPGACASACDGLEQESWEPRSDRRQRPSVACGRAREAGMTETTPNLSCSRLSLVAASRPCLDCRGTSLGPPVLRSTRSHMPRTTLVATTRGPGRRNHRSARNRAWSGKRGRIVRAVG